MYERIRSLRKEKKLTQQQMADILLCSQRGYSNYECGDVDLSTKILIKLSKYHNVTTDYILGLKDDKN